MASRIDLGILLGLAYQTFVDDLRQAMQRHGYTDLGNAYGYVFRALAEQPLHLRQLAERLGITDQGVVKIIDEMEARGYVERRPDPSDGRAKELHLAPRGRKALATARRIHAAYERRLRHKVGTAQLEALRATLDVLVLGSGSSTAEARLRAL